MRSNGISSPTRDRAVFLTHVWSPGVARHYARLKREAGPLVDVFLALQVSELVGEVPSGMAPDIVVRWSDSAERFPRRYAEFVASNQQAPWGFLDLVWLTAFLSSKLAAYQRFWLVEYDVDFSGDWARFFAAAATYEGDLLTSHVRPLSLDPEFWFASSFRQPAAAITDPLIAFMPISRLSRPMIDHYRQTVAEPGWSGHFEILLPSIAAHGGFSVADLGGSGPFVPPERTNLYYSDTPNNHGRGRSTHGFRPVRGYRYFVEAPHRFRESNRIYHPIKHGTPIRERLKYWMKTKRKQLRALGRRLRGVPE